ncbi:ABC transporter [Mastigocoleus testarum BC008]|uniref:ABC transporter n=1 Tax=Mastigocoleus testarum BC008 TaxID=371196 RepID=A0A0V7ZC07_9CYAN|nr:ABC transporter [Mastigocoleus testarum BC008]KST69618.1 ABC transporter [Mastigocoleus testarum BC008]
MRLQLNEVECGAACLATILSYYGRHTRVSECRDCFDVGRDGVSAQHLAEVARNYGLRVKAYAIDMADFRYVPLPAIAHWNFNHFVVVESWSPNRIGIVDPAGGRYQLTTAQFDGSFTGVVLTLEPGAGFEPRGKTSQPLWLQFLIRYTVLQPQLFIQIIGASLLLQCLGLGLPMLTKVFIDRILPFHLNSLMPILAIGIAILMLAQLIVSYLRSALLIYLRARIDIQTILGFFDHLLTLPFRFFEQRSTGDLSMRMGSNAIIREMLTTQSLSVLLDGCFILGYLLILLSQQLFFGLIVLAFGLLQVALLLATTRRVHYLMQKELAAQAEAQSYMVEALTGILTLKATGCEDQAFDRWSNLFMKHLNVSLQRNQLTAIIEAFLQAMRTLSPLVLLWLGTFYVLQKNMSLGTMLAMNAIAALFLAPIASLVTSGQYLQVAGAHLERLTDVLQAESEQGIKTTKAAPKLKGHIEFKNVSFQYDKNAPLVLKNVSFVIQPGQKVAIVGQSGSGKSTLAKLLLGLYRPNTGQILYDGISLENFKCRTWRNQFGVVLQEPFLFSGSIRQNIAFNKPALSLQEVIAAAHIAVIDDEIMQMPMGYETRIAEGGSGLSGGQRQRLSLARALAGQPAILLLDEATSHLDTPTERLVEQNLGQISCTQIIIAHRLSTIRNADLILVLHRGSIVDQGSHTYLLEQRGYYATLVNNQL